MLEEMCKGEKQKMKGITNLHIYATINNEKTLDLLSILKNTPVIVSAYNDDDTFRRKCYRAGMFDFLPFR